MLKARKLNSAFESFRRMWSTTFMGATECGNMVSTEITLNKTIQYNVKLLTSSCLLLLYNYVHSRCTLFGLLLWELLHWQTSIVPVNFQNKNSVSTGHTV